MINVAAIRMQQFGVQFYQASLTASDIDKLVRFEVLNYGDSGQPGVRGGKPKVNGVDIEALGSRESIADALSKIAQATSRYVPLERKAHGIDEASAGEDLSSWLKAQSGLD